MIQKTVDPELRYGVQQLIDDPRVTTPVRYKLARNRDLAYRTTEPDGSKKDVPKDALLRAIDAARSVSEREILGARVSLGLASEVEARAEMGATALENGNGNGSNVAEVASELAVVLAKLRNPSDSEGLVQLAARVATIETNVAETVRRALSEVVAPTVSLTVTCDGAPAVVVDRPHAALARIVKWARIRGADGCRKANILLVGPTGSGKTRLVSDLATALGLPFAHVSCSAGLAESALLGRLLPIELGGRMTYVPAAFVRCFESGGVFLFDEIDAADPSTLLVINAALANGHLAIPSDPVNPTRVKHRDFLCVAAANTFGTGATAQYVGRTRLDEATLDRFRAWRCEVDYDANLETALIRADVLAWGRAVRVAIQTNAMKRVCSTRLLLDLGAAAATDSEFAQRSYWSAQLTLDWSEHERALLRAAGAA